MRKNVPFYLISFALLAVLFLLFGKAYQQVMHYSEHANRSNIIYACYQNLARQVNNAAVINPDLLKATNPTKAENIFFADSSSVIKQLDLLKSVVRDSINIEIANKLDEKIRVELSWMLKSDVPDSIIHHKAAQHVAALQAINELTLQGIERMDFLVKRDRERLHGTIVKLTVWMIVFVIVAAVLLIYTASNLAKQKSKTERKEIELDKTEKLFRHTLDNMMEGVQIHDFEWRYTYVNDALVKYSNYKREELLGYTLMEKYPGIEQIDLFKAMQRVMTGRVAEYLETEFVFPDGTKRDFELSIQPSPEGIFILSVDVTMRKKAEANLQGSLKELTEYKFAVDESSIVAITDQKGIITHVNENFCKVSKYSEAELIGQDHRIINSGYHPKDFIRDLWVTIANGKIWKGELKNKAKDGTIYWVDTTIVPFLNDTGKPYQYLAIRADITERKKAEEELVKTSRLYAFISAVNQSIVHINNQQQLLDTACKVAIEIGKFKVAWIGMLDKNSKLETVSINGAGEITTALKKYSGMDYSSALLINTPTGRVLATGEYSIANDVLNDPVMIAWKEQFSLHGIRANMSLPIKKFGKVIGVFGFSSATENFFDKQEIELLIEAAGDISFALEIFEKERLHKQAELEVIQSEARLKKAQRIAHIGHWELNFATGMAEWSEETCRIYGVNPEERVHAFEFWMSFLHPDDKDLVVNLINGQRRSLSGNSFDHRIVRRDGTVRHIHTESKFEFDASGTSIGLYGVTHDITEQKIAAEKIKYSEAKLAEAQAIAQMGNFEIDMISNALYWSEGMFNVLGHKKDEVIPSNELLLSMVHPGDSERVNKKFSDTFVTLHEGADNFMLIRRDGIVIHVFCEWKFEFDRNNKPVRVYGIVQDVTESKKAEIRIKELNESLEERVKVRTAELVDANKQLESFSYTVSHDLRNPLQVINGYASVMSLKYKETLNDDALQLLKKIQYNTKHMSNIMDDLLDFSKLGSATVTKQLFDMNELVTVVIAELKAGNANFNAEVKLLDLKPAYGDRRLMHQVVINLLSNAVKYSKRETHPVIEIGMAEERGEKAYYVKDNGAGFDMQYYDKLFGVFQRLHKASEFEGTGVGLALVNSIITKHGGKIWAEGKVGGGATFWFSLPLNSS